MFTAISLSAPTPTPTPTLTPTLTPTPTPTPTAPLNSVPQVGDWPTANVALVLSALAALVAIVAVVYTVRTFRRAGARVSVRLRQRRWLFNDIGGGPLLLDVVMVDIGNSGLASVQVSEISWETKGKDTFSITADVAPSEEAPWVLAGLSADLSAYRMDRLVAGAHAEQKAKKVRAVVLLAGTTTEKSEWLTVGG